MHVDLRFLRRPSLVGRAFIEDVDDVVVRFIQLSLGEIREQALVAAMPVDDQNLLASVSRHLVARFLEQLELQSAAVRHGSSLMAGFGDLSEVIFREDDRILLLRGSERRMSNIEKISAQRQMWA